jgi:ABC-2 type transport system permease protein
MTREGATSGASAGTPRPGRTETSSWRLTRLVAKRDYLRAVRRRGYIFGTLLLPVGIATLMAISAIFSIESSQGTTTGAIVIVNESDVPLVEDSDGPIRVALLSADEARRQLDAGQVSGYYVVPADLASSGEVQHVQAASGLGLEQLAAVETQGDLIGYLVRDALLRQAGLDPALAARILQGVTVTTVTTEGDVVSGLDIAAGIGAPIIFVGLFIASIFITSGYLLQSVTEEKENRVVEIVLSSVPSMPLMAGKIIGLGAAGLTQVGIWIATALVAVPLLSSQLPDFAGIDVDPTLLVLALVYFVLGYLTYGAIFAAIGALAPGNREASQYSGFLGIFAAVPFILISVFITDPDSLIVLALALFPLTAPTAMLLILGMSETTPWYLVAASLLSLTIFTVLATWASARIFRATVLLYGVRPSLTQIMDAVRTAR